jgi:hypothetical protein
MKNNLVAAAIVGVLMTSSFFAAEVPESTTDLVVIGSTPGGVACAVRAAREGLHVVLVNHHAHLGGMLTSGLGYWDTLYDGKRSPIFDEVRQGMIEYYRVKYGENSVQHRAAMPDPDRTKWSRGMFEPHVAEKVITDMVKRETNIAFLAGYYAVEMTKKDRIVTSVTVRQMNGPGVQRLAARAFVDATYEGDLAALAGVECRIGREGRAEYGEEHAGKIFVRMVPTQTTPEQTLMHRIGLRPYGAGHVYEVSDKSPGSADKAIQAYNTRPFLTCDPKRRMAPSKPVNYRRNDYLKFDRRYVGDAKMTINSGNSFNAPILVGENHDWPTADWATRKKIEDAHWDWCVGLLYFMQNDQTIPEKQREDFRRWGLPRDEFADNNNRPYEIYVREARRIVGRYVFREQDARMEPGRQRSPSHSDSVTVVEWPLDSHSCTTDQITGYPYDGKMNLGHLSVPGQVPYRCLLPREVDNLLVPVCLSATHVGWGSIRLEPVWMSTGEAAGFAAALAHRAKTTPAEVNVDQLQRMLIEKGFIVAYFADAGIGSGNPWVPAVQWCGTRGYFTTYEARPDELLTRSVAQAWAKSQPAATTNDAPVTAQEFVALLSDDHARQTVGQLGIALDKPLTRGDACRLLQALGGKP